MLLQMAKYHSFLWLSSVPLYIYNIYIYCIYKTSSLSIHLLIDTGCFHMLAIVTNDAMNIRMHVSFQISIFFSDIYPGVELLGHMVALLLVF